MEYEQEPVQIHPDQGQLFEDPTVEAEREAHQAQVDFVPSEEWTVPNGVRWLGRRVLEVVKAIPLGHIYERKD